MSENQGCQGWTKTPIAKNEEGLYKVQLGRFGLINQQGYFVDYLTPEVIESLQTRAKNRVLYGEFDVLSRHKDISKVLSGFAVDVTSSDSENLSQIQIETVTHSICSIEVTTETIDGCVVQILYGYIKPLRYLLDEITNLLDNEDSVIKFGYRALYTSAFDDSKKTEIVLKQIVTFDIYK